MKHLLILLVLFQSINLLANDYDYELSDSSYVSSSVVTLNNSKSSVTIVDYSNAESPTEPTEIAEVMYNLYSHSCKADLREMIRNGVQLNYWLRFSDSVMLATIDSCDELESLSEQ